MHEKKSLLAEQDVAEHALLKIIHVGEEEIRSFQQSFRMMQEEIYQTAKSTNIHENPEVRRLLAENETFYYENLKKAEQTLSDKKAELAHLRREHEAQRDNFTEKERDG